MGTYSAAERRTLGQAISAGLAPECPACRTPVVVRAVERPEEVAYVRHRVWILCPACKRTAAVDADAGGPAGE
jgi:hypothetical protein